MKLLIIPILILFSVSAISQTSINIIPMPAILTQTDGYFRLDGATVILARGTLLHDADMLNHYLEKFYGITLPVKKMVPGQQLKNAIALGIIRPGDNKRNEYFLVVAKDNIHIGGVSDTAVFYGIQTLLQLLPADKDSITTHGFEIPGVTIKDFPRFQYRGMHLDVGRHFFNTAEVKRYIDFLAYHKFNTFHWHLTEDQGWRIEIKKYPRLTAVGGFRNGTIIGHSPGTRNDSIQYGGFYTQIEIKEIVKYAQDRYITIIPEIELPGHSSAAIAAYPKLSCFPEESTQIKDTALWAGRRTGKQVQQTWGVFQDVFCPSKYTFKFLQNVLDEVMQLFPSKYIHIGGDECPKDAWKRSAFCQKLIQEKNLKDEHGLQSYFISRIEKYVNSKGRSIIGWDEILEGGLAPNATVMSWRGEDGGIAAAKQHHHVIMTPGRYVYFDHAQIRNEDSVTIGGYLPLDSVYNYEPVPGVLNAKEAKYVLGAQGNVWSEYIGTGAKLEYMIFPRMSALSEVLWSPKDMRDWNDFKRRLPDLVKRYGLWKVNYCTIQE